MNRQHWVVAACGAFALASGQLRAQTPLPGGAYEVGTRRFEWTDTSRREVAALLRLDSAGVAQPVPASGPRRIVVQVWYPASGSASMQRAGYNPRAVAFEGLIRDTARLQRYRTMTGHGAQDAASAAGKFPLVFFSPGSSMFLEDYTILFEALASHGYVVAALGYPGTS